MNPYYNEPLSNKVRQTYDDQTQMVASWAKDISRQSPELSWGQCIELAEKWLIEWRQNNWA